MSFDQTENYNFDPYSKGNDITQQDIKGWNWGAFFLNWIWGLFNGTFLPLITWVPIFGWFIWPFVCGAKGNEWAWNGKDWESVEKFHQSQKKWATAGTILFLIINIPAIICVILFSTFIFGTIASLSTFQNQLNSGGNNYSQNYSQNAAPMAEMPQNSMPNSNMPVNAINNPNMQQNNMPNSNMPAYNVNNPNMPQNAQVPGQINTQEEKTVLVSINNSGRSNPFMPYTEKTLIATPTRHIDIPPPPTFNPNPTLTNLMTIKVAGILFDKMRPSAIVNVNNADYLVHKGDKIFNYYIQDITSKKVAIRSGANVYKTGIGEIVEEGTINSNPVQGLDKMFAGNPSATPLPKIRFSN